MVIKTLVVKSLVVKHWPNHGQTVVKRWSNDDGRAGDGRIGDDDRQLPAGPGETIFERWSKKQWSNGIKGGQKVVKRRSEGAGRAEGRTASGRAGRRPAPPATAGRSGRRRTRPWRRRRRPRSRCAARRSKRSSGGGNGQVPLGPDCLTSISPTGQAPLDLDCLTSISRKGQVPTCIV